MAFADELRASGHTVHTPDLYEGRTFEGLEEGVDHAEKLGMDTIVERGRDAAEELWQPGLVYAGMSLGVMPAWALTQTEPDPRGALFLHSAVSVSGWPHGVPLQVHTSEHDDWGDVEVARKLPEQIDTAEVFIYPGDRHLFTDSSLPVYDEQATALLLERVRAFLEGLDD